MGNISLLPARTVEQHVLGGEPGSFPSCEKDRRAGSITDTGRKGAMQVGKDKSRNGRKPRAVWEEGMQKDASCLVRMSKGEEGPRFLESDRARLPGSTWPGPRGTASHLGVG